MLNEIIEAERNDSIECIKEEIANGYMSKEELTEDYIEALNHEIIQVLFNNFKKGNVKFNLYSDFTGEYYKTMLGTGKEIEYEDLYEIVSRLYHYHHENNTFTLKFEDYSIQINKKLVDELESTSKIVIEAIGKDWFLKADDFN